MNCFQIYGTLTLLIAYILNALIDDKRLNTGTKGRNKRDLLHLFKLTKLSIVTPIIGMIRLACIEIY